MSPFNMDNCSVLFKYLKFSFYLLLITKAERLVNDPQDHTYTLILKRYSPKVTVEEVQCNGNEINAEGIQEIEIKNINKNVVSCNCLLQPSAKSLHVRGSLSIKDQDQRKNVYCPNCNTCSSFSLQAFATEVSQYQMQIGEKLEITDPDGNYHSFVQPMQKVIKINYGYVTVKCKRRSHLLPSRPTGRSNNINTTTHNTTTQSENESSYILTHYKIIVGSILGSVVLNVTIILVVICIWKKCERKKKKSVNSTRTGSRGNYAITRMSYEVPTQRNLSDDTNNTDESHKYTALQGARNLAMNPNNHTLTINNDQDQSTDDFSAYEPCYSNNDFDTEIGTETANNSNETNQQNRAIGELYTIQEEPNSQGSTLKYNSKEGCMLPEAHAVRRQSSSYDYVLDTEDEHNEHVKRHSSHKYLELS